MARLTQKSESEQFYTCLRGTWIGPESDILDGELCPYCKSPVAKTDIKKHWKDAADTEVGVYEWPSYKKTAPPDGWRPRPHPGYVAFWRWAMSQNRCFNQIMHMKNSYAKHMGIEVDVEP